MRARLLSESLALTPGRPARIDLEVVNDLEIIDGVQAAIEGAPGLTWQVSPASVPLFPEDSGRLTLELSAAPTFPAGDHEILVTVTSAAGGPPARLRLPLNVAAAPGAALKIKPLVRSGRHRARYRVQIRNTGNTPLEMSLVGSDPNRQAPVRFERPVVSVGPGESALSAMSVSCRRHLFGGDISHQLSVVASTGALEADARAVFRQTPVIPRGVRTAFILVLIVALWAGIFATLLSRALAGDPLTKQVPASFYASLGQANRAQLSSLGGARGPVGLAAASTAAPAGAVPKSGLVIGVGGSVAGTVEAASTGTGIGRINVEIFRAGGGSVPVASAATAANGTYAVPGLLPGSYTVLFEAQGFRPVWYPAATSAAAARPVTVQALQTTARIDATIAGLPGTVTGLVDTGVSPSPPVTVTVQPEQGASSRPVATVRTNALGAYTIAGLPTPGTYDLSFTSPDFQLASATDVLSGGEHLIANTVVLSAADGSISGSVTAGKTPLGGVTITAQANGQTFTVATPTTGPVGEFSFVNLPSPATYLLTFTKAGYGTVIVGEQLGPGQNLAHLAVHLSGGAGDIAGVVSSSAGTPLGGATVSVDGVNPAVSTETLTAGAIGSYSLSGLATPATYTLTFSAPGHESRTIAVSLPSSGSAGAVDVRLPSALATITGRVVGPSGTLAGVGISATDGTTVTTTTSTSQPAGGFLLSGLSPGSYAVTFTSPGLQPATYLVAVAPGQTRTLRVRLRA